MKKFYWPLFCSLLAAATLGAQTPKVTLSGTKLTSVIFAPNTQTWISGTVTVTKNDASVAWVTVDLSPKSKSPGNSDKFRQEWKNVTTPATILKLAEGQVYFSQTISDSNVIRMWGIDGDALNDIKKSNVFSYIFPANSAVGATVSFNYAFMFSHSSIPLAGTYEPADTMPFSFRVRLEEFKEGFQTTTIPVPGASFNPKPSFVVLPMGNVKLYSGTTGAVEIGAMDFGTIIAMSTTQQFRITVATNYRYSLKVTSRRGGNFFHQADQSLPSGGTPTILPIPYSFSVLEPGTTTPATIALSTSEQTIVEYAAPTAGAAVERIAAITVGDVDGYTWGTYSDSLSFVLTAM